MKKVAIIGSRKMSNYGQEVVLWLVPVLVKKDCCIVTAKTNGVNAEVARVTRLYGGELEIVDGNKGMEKMNLEIAQKSDKLIVVEGGENSGTILVAKAFLDLNKEVWAVPGRITDLSSAAPNFLIANGAGVLTVGDMIDDNGWHV